MVRLGLAGKIWVCIGILGVGFLSILALSWINAQYLSKQLKKMKSDQLPAVLSCQYAMDSYKQVRQMYSNAVVSGEKDLLEEVDKRVFSTIAEFQKIRTERFDPEWSGQVRALCTQLTDFHTRARTPYQNLIDNPESVDLETLKRLADEGDRLEADFESLCASATANYESLLMSTNSRMQNQQGWNLVAFLVFSIIAGLGVFYIVSNKIVTPVRDVVQAARGIASGDYSQRIDYELGDEMGDLVVAFNQMTAHLEDTLKGLREEVMERRRAEEEAHTLNAELEDRVKERTDGLSSTNENLKESMERLRATQNKLVETEKMASLGGLVAGVAHEINTPIGIGVTMTTNLMKATQELVELMDSGGLKKSSLSNYSETVLETAEILEVNLVRAAELIQSFKQVAVDQTGEQVRTFNLNEYVDEVLSSLRPQFKRTSHGSEYNCPDDCIVTTYPGALAQVLTNLVSNSLLHGFDDVENGRIHMGFTDGKETIACVYRDNGVGMSKRALDKIFDPFFTTKRNVGGAGLGMSVTYNLLTQKMGGDISCTSNPGEGATFNFTFIKELSVLEE